MQAKDRITLIKTILITGINGYLGSKIAQELSSSFNIVGLEYDIDDLYRVKKCNYQIYSSRQGVPEDVFINHAIDCVIHTATLYGRGSEILNDMLLANLIVPLEILDKAIKNGSELFINTDTVLDRFVSDYSLTNIWKDVVQYSERAVQWRLKSPGIIQQ